MRKSGGSRLAGVCRIQRQSGFTLVELLIVVAIIGILALIAITQLTIYREKAYCAEVKSDLATLAAHQEAYFIDNHVYLAVTQAPDGASNVPNFRWSTGVALVSSLGGVSAWNAVLGHPSCSVGPFTWDSATGGLH